MKTLSYEQLARQIVQQHLNAFLIEEKGVRENRDIEYLHRMRVASRRLRNALNLFQDIFINEDLMTWENVLEEAAGQLGQARDLDVKIEFIKNSKGTIKNPSLFAGIQQLLKAVQEERKSVQPYILEALDHLHQKNVLKKLEITLDYLKEDKNNEVIKIAQKKVSKRLKKLLSLEEYVLKPTAVKELHLMRIAAKNLRYTLENFEALYGTKTQSFIETVRLVQKNLGELHDFDVWLAGLPKFLEKYKDDAALKNGIGYFKEYCEGLRVQSYHDFVHLWGQLKVKKFFKELEDLIERGH